MLALSVLLCHSLKSFRLLAVLDSKSALSENIIVHHLLHCRVETKQTDLHWNLDGIIYRIPFLSNGGLCTGPLLLGSHTSTIRSSQCAPPQIICCNRSNSHQSTPVMADPLAACVLRPGLYLERRTQSNYIKCIRPLLFSHTEVVINTNKLEFHRQVPKKMRQIPLILGWAAASWPQTQ